MDYEDAIKILYKALKEKNKLIELIKEDYTDYDILEENTVEVSQEENDTRISTFKKIIGQLLLRYNEELPEEVLILLRS